MSVLLICVFGFVIESRVTFTLSPDAVRSIYREIKSTGSIESKGSILRTKCGEMARVAYPADLAYFERAE
jgi:hypothetical protein